MNPYAPTASPPCTKIGSTSRRDVGVLMIAAILILAVFMAVLQQLFPAIRNAMMPRFGWIGLLLCMNPLVHLYFWYKTPVRRNLLAASFVTMFLGVVNAVLILVKGTVSTVQNPFIDRLHSSWLWAVVPFFVAAAYLYWRALSLETALPTPEDGEAVTAFQEVPAGPA